MNLMGPSCYSDFHCIADQCRHSCCIGWDVVVDDETAAYYRSVNGAFGERLCGHLHVDEDGDTLFSMRENGRCPFLNERGLCDIIVTLGEDALCQICDDHPRYYHVFSDRTEVGLGLSCEAAAALILGSERPMSLVMLSLDEPLSPTAEESAFFAVRERLFAVAQDRSCPIPERQEMLMNVVGKTFSPLSPSALYDIFSPLERLDDAWTQTLEALHTPPTYQTPSDTVLEQLLWYFLHRHTADSLDDGRLSARVAFAVHSVSLLSELAKRIGSDFETMCELSRQYSAEIEYSDENPDTLFERFS